MQVENFISEVIFSLKLKLSVHGEPFLKNTNSNNILFCTKFTTLFSCVSMYKVEIRKKKQSE